MHRLAMILAGGALLGGLSARLAADTYPRQTGLQIGRYSFEVTLSDANNEIEVNETVALQFTADGVSAIDLDLCGTRAAGAAPAAGAPADPCVGARRGGASPGGGGLSGSANETSGATGMTVTAVTANGAGLHFTHEHDRLHIEFPRASKAGERFSFEVVYHGIPSTGFQIGNNKYGDREFFSNDWPDLARNWLAVIDHPYMKAAKTMTTIAPRKYQVISNGLMTESTDLPNDLRRTVWVEEAPIASWQISLGVAPFAVSNFGNFHGIGLSAWVYPQDRDGGFKASSEWTEPILEFYVDHIGPYSYEKLAQVEANTVSGGMELASDIFYSFAPTGPQRQLLAHEMAHQWFGDSATEKDWDDVWLSEGFATYFALLYQEHQDGREAFVNGVKGSAASAMRYALANPSSTVVHQNLADVSKVIANNAQIYQGGAMVLHMLRGVLGDDNFWAGIRLYYSRFRNSNASSLDLQHAMQDACVESGHCEADQQDLSWFFKEWLNRGGILQVQGTWHYDAAAKALSVSLTQTQPGELYRMPIEIGITPGAVPAEAEAGRGGRGGGRGGAAPAPKIVVADKVSTLTIPMATEPGNVVLDPNTWVPMMQATLVKQ